MINSGTGHTAVLHGLAAELFAAEGLGRLLSVSGGSPTDYAELFNFDQSLGGPSITAIADTALGGGTLGISGFGVGRYTIGDRDVFRPLQYCAVYLHPQFADVVWLTRGIVEASCAHIESLIKRIGSVPRLPLGKALRNRRVASMLEPELFAQVAAFATIYNASKHDFDQDKDSHMFSIEDAVLAYFVARKMGMRLYPLAHLSTDLRVFDATQ